MRRKLLRYLIASLTILIIVYVVLAFTSPSVDDYPFFDQEGVMVIAHQGGEGLRPSNTMASFSHAVELGVDVLEMDIHSTLDGIIVVIHDDTVDRTTDGSGSVQEMTLDALKELDAGYYWTDDKGATYPFRGQGITIPTLEELLVAFPQMRMNIEIKQETPSIVRPFCQLLRDHNMTEKVLVASFHETTIKEFRSECPGIATSMVESEIRLLYVLSRVFLGAIFRAPAEAIQVPEYSGDLHIVTEQFVDATHAHNVNFHVWTVNEAADMRRVLSAGIDGIITDRPDRLLELLGR